MHPSEMIEIIHSVFNSRSIAVVGASQDPLSNGYQYLRFLLDSNYAGRVYPVNPRNMDILGVKAYPSLEQIPGDIDYVICCISASQVLDLLRQCAQKRVRAVHLFTAKLRETGDENAARLEEEIKLKAQQLGIRLLGPNCMGIYNPAKRIIFNHDLSLESGSVGAIVQSGGLAGEIVRLAALRGVRFSKAVSYGNAADLDAIDFLEYFLWDEETKVILIYIEGTKNGRKLFETLRKAAKTKPVIILKGGRSKAGARSVASHTASIAGSLDAWQVVFRQCKLIQAHSLNEMLDLCVAFYFLPPIYGKKVGIVGGGGGKSVLACDEYEEADMEVVPFPENIKDFLENKTPEISRWLGNPVDASILAGTNIRPSELIRSMAQSPNFDLLSINTSEDSLFDQDLWIDFIQSDINECLTVQREKLKPVVAVVGNPEMGAKEMQSWRWQALLRFREQLINEKVPLFSTPARAASAVSKLVDYYRYSRMQGEKSNESTI